MNRRLVWVGVMLVVTSGAARWAGAAEQEARAATGEEKEQAADSGEPADKAPAPEPAAAPVPVADPLALSVGAPATPDGLISVDFKDADIRQVLRIIALKSGVDIVAGPDVEGLVTIKLTGVPWQEALDIILRTYSLTYERKENIIRVMTLEAVEQEALSNQVYPLNYAKAKEVADIVKEMLSDRGKVKFDERTNTVIVTDLPSNLFQLKQVVERLDQPTPQVRIESRFVETRLTKDENLGVDWFDAWTITTQPAVQPTTFPFPGGAEFGALSAFFPRAGEFDPSSGASLPKGRVPERGGTFTFGTISPGILAVTINALKSRVDTNVISNPTIVTLNNKEATVQVGTDVNIPNFQIDPSTGRATISGFQTRSTGIILKVTPHVNLQEEIVMDVNPEITTIGNDRNFGTGGGTVTFPDFNVQKAQTQVRLLNGETLAIGGLKRQANSVTSNKIPVLGDIPLIGRFFENRHTQTPSGQDQIDLLIFMTVRLVKPPSIPAGAIAAEPVRP